MTDNKRAPLRFASARDIADWRRELPEEFLSCRDYGHLWRPSSARYLPSENAYERTMRCGRCHTERTQTLSASGAILGGGYDYADGYVAPKGQGRLGTEARDSLRLESVLRLLAIDPGPERASSN